jgi:uncharacterized protein (TIGR04222 family)
MNPFDWHGPQFLLFYVVLATATITIAWVRRRRADQRLSSRGVARLTDPYAIALLRGGKNEMVRVVTLSLVDRGLLRANGDIVSTAQAGREARPDSVAERELLQMCLVPRDPAELFAEPFCADVANRYENEFARDGLFPNQLTRSARAKIFAVAAGFLIAVAGIKIVVALGRGRTNVMFLILLTVLAVFVLNRVVRSRRTVKGSQYVAELKNLFRSLLGRPLHAGGGTTELAMLAAIWGVTAIPTETYPWAEELFKRSFKQGGGSSCGSSCGSSSDGARSSAVGFSRISIASTSSK